MSHLHVKSPTYRIALLAVCLALLAGCSNAPGALSGAAPNGTLKVAIDSDNAPFASLEAGQKEPKGYDVDMLRAVAASAGMSVEWVPVPRGRAVSRAAGCVADAAAGALVTEELKAQKNITDPYLSVGHVLLVQKGNVTIRERTELEGMNVGVPAGSPALRELQAIPKATLLRYTATDDAVQDLMTGLIDAVDVPRLVAKTYASIPANGLKLVGTDFAPEDYAVIVCPQKLELASQLSAGLQAIKANGTLARITAKWLPE
jgi:ABC-type amino acid transport substrate-binding protein